MMCEACKRGDHDECGMQTWCECDCEGIYGQGIGDGFDPLDDSGYDANDGTEGSN